MVHKKCLLLKIVYYYYKYTFFLLLYTLVVSNEVATSLRRTHTRIQHDFWFQSNSVKDPKKQKRLLDYDICIVWCIQYNLLLQGGKKDTDYFLIVFCFLFCFLNSFILIYSDFLSATATEVSLSVYVSVCSCISLIVYSLK